MGVRGVIGNIQLRRIESDRRRDELLYHRGRKAQTPRPLQPID